MQSVGVWWMWLIFALIVTLMLAIDLLVFKGGHKHKVSFKEAASWSAVWVLVSLLFCAGLWAYLYHNVGAAAANEQSLLFLTAYLLEKSLAVDNIFVWMLIFSYFTIPVELQRRVLLYGIVGAIVLRTLMIFSGSWLINEFSWILYLFAAFLIFTGIKMLFPEQEVSLAENPLLRFLKKHMRISDHLIGERFFTREKGMLYATPLFLALLLVEISDIVFAVDSIPAVLALTTDPFIVLTSNLFAILGLRAMYFLMADIGDKFSLLKYGLAVILVFIGVKMLIVEWIEIPVLLSLSVVLGVLTLSILLSIRHNKTTKFVD